MVGHYRGVFISRLLRSALPLLLVAGCAVNPQSGRREVILVSEEKEKKVDEEAAKQVEQQLGLVADPDLTAYVDALGQELASHALRQKVDYVFNVVEMPEPNAFALPGGHIYVSRGLLALTNSEAELANVLGHEIGHVTARHAAQRESKAVTATVLTVLAAVAAAAAGRGDVAAGVAQFGVLGQYGLIAAYGRVQEAEADRIGQELAADAGVDPNGMALFLRQLDSETRLRAGSSRLPSFFDTHPATPERVAETVTNAQVIRWRPGFAIAPTRGEFLQRLDGLVIGQPAAEGVFRGDRLMHAEMGFSLRFPPGWSQVNQRDQVIAIAPARDAVVELRLQGMGNDPREAAAAYSDQENVRFHTVTPVQIGRLPAFRARTALDGPYGPSAAEITWIAFGGRIYRLTSWSPSSNFSKYEGTFRSFARGFRPITDEERAQVDELRLRIVAAEHCETLAALSERSDSEWSLNEIAVANAWLPDKPLPRSYPVKIAHRELYSPGSPAAAEASEAAVVAKPAGQPDSSESAESPALALAPAPCDAVR